MNSICAIWGKNVDFLTKGQIMCNSTDRRYLGQTRSQRRRVEGWVPGAGGLGGGDGEYLCNGCGVLFGEMNKFCGWMAARVAPPREEPQFLHLKMVKMAGFLFCVSYRNKTCLFSRLHYVGRQPTAPTRKRQKADLEVDLNWSPAASLTSRGTAGLFPLESRSNAPAPSTLPGFF